MKKYLKQGPLGGYIYTSDNLYLYHNGIIRKDDSCKNIGNQVNHAVFFVGYGTENGIDYW